MGRMKTTALVLVLLALASALPARAGSADKAREIAGNGWRDPSATSLHADRERWDDHDDDHDDDDDDDDHDQDRARAAVLKGEAVPLARIMQDPAVRDAGRFLEAELDHHHGRLLYRLRLLGPDGTLTRLIFDAKSGTLLERRQGKRNRDHDKERD
ncbi:PepSY domain-containing protein [Pararhodospirillum oryzae]|uniref:PepSY domain-containing protein n=1 Tax=Pararhodospirillum oryzae TaxID=478448 RepID=A0A512H3N3_9PROT|nr:hypothetical protein [Pararhodospirillum oryzae]GEO80010.1 hypothetical protein ROR02_01410 [Pararhodospirillum oryzae]